MGRARDIANIINSGTFITPASASTTFLTQTSASTIYAPASAGGLVQIVPTSVSTTGGSATIASNGVITFTSAATLNINNCFSTTYNNYKIILDSVMTIGSNADTQLRMRLRSASGEDSENQYGGGYSMPYYGNNAINLASGVQPGTYVPITTAFYSGGTSSVIFDLTKMNGSPGREFKGICIGGNASSGAYGFFVGSKSSNNTVHTGITFYSNTSGVFTGTMSVYGYKN
jgi:hypothetical protein